MSLLEQIFCNYWFVTPQLERGFLPIVANLISGKELPLSEKKELIESRNAELIINSAVPSEVASFNYGFNPKNETDRVGIIKLSGVMIKEDQLSTWGTDRVYDLLKSAGERSNIVSTVILANTGGGASDSAENVFNLIKSYESTYGKPVITIVDGMLGSAGYYALSSSDKIFTTGNGVAVGSIGTYASIYDYTEFLNNAGIKEIIVKATKSINKNSAYEAAIAGDTEPLKREILDPIQKAFENAVLNGRMGKIESTSEVLKGGLYFGKDALKMGLIDGILNKEDAIDYAFRVGIAKRKKKKVY